MTEHQASPERADLRIVEGVSPARLHGEACIHCGSAEPPLCPDGRVQTRVSKDVLKTWDIVTCLLCRAIALNPRDRYEIERQPPVGELSGLYAIRDKTTGELVPSSAGDEPELFMLDFSAKHWIAERTAPEASRGR